MQAFIRHLFGIIVWISVTPSSIECKPYLRYLYRVLTFSLSQNVHSITEPPLNDHDQLLNYPFPLSCDDEFSTSYLVPMVDKPGSKLPLHAFLSVAPALVLLPLSHAACLDLTQR